MAKPPIIISNNGVIGQLARDSIDPEAEQKIKDNMIRINEEDLTEGMVIIKGGSKAPCVYWRLKTDDDYNTKFKPEFDGTLENSDLEKKGREGISVNDLFDLFDDSIE
jgi:hypothetical protein